MQIPVCRPLSLFLIISGICFPILRGMSSIITLTNQKKIQNFSFLSQPATISLCVTSQSWSAVNPVADQLRYDFYFLFSPKSGHKYRPTVSQMSRHTQCLVLSENLFLFRKVQRTRQKFSPIICIIVSAQLIQFTAGAKRLPLHILKLSSRVWL